MSKMMAILIETSGEITMPDFCGLADTDHPCGRLWYLRDLIDSADPIGVVVPGSGLVAWLDDFAHERKLHTNIIASSAFADALEPPMRTICGPVVVTGGSLKQPRPLTSFQVVKAMSRLGLNLYPNAAFWLLQNVFVSSDAAPRSASRW
jgi:hypothetical protein